ncbi:MAG: chemotaxis protein CheC [Candidatus Omnitrophota bacterium]
MERMDQFNELEISALKELVNIGISHVATAIGEISREKVDISLPELKNFSKNELLSLGENNTGIVYAYLRVEGISALTETLIVLTEKQAFELMEKFVNVEGCSQVNTKKLSKDEQKSIFSEISGIITATYFSAVETTFNIKTHHGVPEVSFNHNKTKDFIQQMLQQEEGMLIQVSFSIKGSNLEGKFLLIPDLKTINIFFEKIGIIA